MDQQKFLNLLNENGISCSLLLENRSRLFESLALTWEWGLVFGKVVDKALLRPEEGKPLSEHESLVVRQIGALHSKHRAALRKFCLPDVLRSLGEARVSAIMRDQMPVTEAMQSILKEFTQKLASDQLAAIAFLTSNAIDVNQRDRDGLTPISYAAQFGAEKCLFALCKHGANPHVVDSMGNSALHWACAMGKDKAITVLLYHGANPNAVSDAGITPLMLALNKSNLTVAQKLLDYGADIRMKDRKGNSVLHRAVLAKNYDQARFLISCGAVVDDPNASGQTAFGLSSRDQRMHLIFKNEFAGISDLSVLRPTP